MALRAPFSLDPFRHSLWGLVVLNSTCPVAGCLRTYESRCSRGRESLGRCTATRDNTLDRCAIGEGLCNDVPGFSSLTSNHGIEFHSAFNTDWSGAADVRHSRGRSTEIISDYHLRDSRKDSRLCLDCGLRIPGTGSTDPIFKYGHEIQAEGCRVRFSHSTRSLCRLVQIFRCDGWHETARFSTFYDMPMGM